MFYCLTLPLFVKDMAKNKKMTVSLEASGEKKYATWRPKKNLQFLKEYCHVLTLL